VIEMIILRNDIKLCVFRDGQWNSSGNARNENVTLWLFIECLKRINQLIATILYTRNTRKITTHLIPADKYFKTMPEGVQNDDFSFVLLSSSHRTKHIYIYLQYILVYIYAYTYIYIYVRVYIGSSDRKPPRWRIKHFKLSRLRAQMTRRIVCEERASPSRNPANFKTRLNE